MGWACFVCWTQGARAGSGEGVGQPQPGQGQVKQYETALMFLKLQNGLREDSGLKAGRWLEDSGSSPGKTCWEPGASWTLWVGRWELRVRDPKSSMQRGTKEQPKEHFCEPHILTLLPRRHYCSLFHLRRHNGDKSTSYLLAPGDGCRTLTHPIPYENIHSLYENKKATHSFRGTGVHSLDPARVSWNSQLKAQCPPWGLLCVGH